MAKREWPRRLGFAVKVAGREGLKSNDARRWQSGPHLSVSMDMLRAILDYLDEIDVRMYRISSDFVPYCTHPDLPQFHGQIAECRTGLAELGRIARQRGIRLSLHPSQYVLLSALDPAINARGIWDVNSQAELLDAMEQGPEAIVILHLGGAYGDKESAMRRFALDLPPPGEYGVGQLYLPKVEAHRKEIQKLFTRAVEESNQQVLGWRSVETRNHELGESVKSTEPDMYQVFIKRGKNAKDPEAFERKLYVIRKYAERLIRDLVDQRTRDLIGGDLVDTCHALLDRLLGGGLERGEPRARPRRHQAGARRAHQGVRR